ncbi:MAG TPA: 2OG-Fe(II) oxygenase [Rhizomicrobium sp.]|nr:2OG-Fe(II) oxygenase [Rhizomicrobium sp.]
MLADFIKAYDGTLPMERCRELIARFEAAPELQERKESEDAYNFAQINVSQHWPEVEAEIGRIFMTALRQYHKSLDIGACWPLHPVPEQIRMKRYLPDGRDSFPVHVDVMDDQSARRFVTAILYLNEPQGGETSFPTLGVTVKPLAGRLSIFPPLWLFPHAGNPPRDQAKYILHGYLWYPVENANPYPI